MLYEDFKEYLEEVSEKSDFKVNVKFEGGYIVFSNTGQRGDRKFFTLSLLSIRNMIQDILNNYVEFKNSDSYVEQEWRDLSRYYTDETIKSIATVQTKPLFTTLGKIINWANEIENYDEKSISMKEEFLEKTIEKLDKIMNSFVFSENVNDTLNKENIEELFKIWLKNHVDTSAPLSTYPLALKSKIPEYLHSLGEKQYKNLFECNNISYLKKLHKRLLKGGDLHEFNVSLQSRLASAAVSKYIDFIYEKNTEISRNNEIVGISNFDTKGNLNFPYKNLLLKGVPGTGKSQTIEDIIEKDLNIKGKAVNICRINIHSGSSNADLMQGIGISTKGGDIEYKEKQGLIYNHVKKALFSPNQPFVLVLEEIQENSLNELIGDLIYLIEDKKRVKVDAGKFEDKKEYDYQTFIEQVLEDDKNEHYIEIPYLVDTSTKYKKMVLPSNLYVFCTSNYRDDKKVIEDNLLRRFDVVEIYPQTQETLGKSIFKSTDVSDFLGKLNDEILKKFEDETHPDRYLVGHANWLDITESDTNENKKLFYTALLKVLIEFKEIREVDFEAYAKEIVESVCKDVELSDRLKAYIDACDFEYKSYKEMVEKLQKEIYSFLK